MNLLKIWWLFTLGIFLAGSIAFYLMTPFAPLWSIPEKMLISVAAGFAFALLPSYLGTLFWLDERRHQRKINRVKRFADRLR